MSMLRPNWLALAYVVPPGWFGKDAPPRQHECANELSSDCQHCRTGIVSWPTFFPIFVVRSSCPLSKVEAAQSERSVPIVGQSLRICNAPQPGPHILTCIVTGGSIYSSSPTPKFASGAPPTSNCDRRLFRFDKMKHIFELLRTRQSRAHAIDRETKSLLYSTRSSLVLSRVLVRTLEALTGLGWSYNHWSSSSERPLDSTLRDVSLKPVSSLADVRMTDPKKYQAMLSMKSQPTKIQAVLYLDGVSQWTMLVVADPVVPNIVERNGNGICIDKSNDRDDELHGCHAFGTHVAVQRLDWDDRLKWGIGEGE